MLMIVRIPCDQAGCGAACWGPCLQAWSAPAATWAVWPGWSWARRPHTPWQGNTPSYPAPRSPRAVQVWHGVVWYGMAWYGMVWYGKAWHDAQSIICFALVFAPSPPHPSTDAPCQRSFFATTDILPIGIFTTTTITCNSSSRLSFLLGIAKHHLF